MKTIKSSHAFRRLLALMVIGISFLLVGCTVTTTVEEIVLSTEEVNIKVGEEVTVTATVLPAEASQTVKWESEDTSIATVKDGKIKGVADGATEITVTAGKVTNFVTVYVASVNNNTNLIDKVLEDTNFVNCVSVMTFSMTGTDADVQMTSTTKIDGNVTFTTIELAGETITSYTLKENNTIYSATNMSAEEDFWFVLTTTLDTTIEIAYLDEFNIDDFTLTGGYYVLKDSKVQEYLSIFDDIEGYDENNELTDFDVKFKIVDGKLMEMYFKIVMTLDALPQTIESQMVFSDYGKVNLIIPDEVQNAIDEYKAQN